MGVCSHYIRSHCEGGCWSLQLQGSSAQFVRGKTVRESQCGSESDRNWIPNQCFPSLCSHKTMCSCVCTPVLPDSDHFEADRGHQQAVCSMASVTCFVMDCCLICCLVLSARKKGFGCCIVHMKRRSEQAYPFDSHL